MSIRDRMTKSTDSTMKKIVEIVLSVVIIGVTLAFGGVQPIAYSLMEIAIFATALAVLIHQVRAGRIGLPVPLWASLFALWVVLELVPLPLPWLSRIDPARILPAALRTLQHRATAWVPITLYPHATLIYLMKFLAYLAAFILAAWVYDSQQKKALLIRVLIFLGLFEAAYGIVQYLAHWQQIFWMKKVYYTSMGTGTYINHNHFAGFMELTFPFMLALVFYHYQIWQDGRRRGPARVPAATTSAAGVQALFYSFLLVVAIIGVIFSKSRAGIMGTVFVVVFLAILAQLKTRRKVWAIGLAAFVLVAVAYGLWIGLNPVVARFEMFRGGVSYLETEGRLSFWKATLAMIHDYPVTGIGLGTYVYGFPHYQTYFLNFLLTHAHNDYVEIASETGVPGVLLLFVPIIVLLARMIHAFITDVRRYRTSVILGCIGGTAALLIHSAVDFNLRIPANALVFAVVLGIGYKAACLERRGEAHPLADNRHQTAATKR